MRKINFNCIDHKASNMNWELADKDGAIIKGNISNSSQVISGVQQALLLGTFPVDTFINDVYEEGQHASGILQWELLQVQATNQPSSQNT
jgi:hypothetical protein